MATGKQLVILLSTIVALLTFADGFPDGAPVDACVKPKPNQPYHGQAKPQPLGTNPYSVIASAEEFGPGSQITGMSVKLFSISINFPNRWTISTHTQVRTFYL